jgi:hypothetical protein
MKPRKLRDWKMTMTLLGLDVLLVGQSFNSAQCLMERLRRRGFRCRVASNLRAACQLLESLPVDMVLTNMRLSDGNGFKLLGLLAGLPVTVFLCLPIETGCFWLPAIDAGKDCLGLPALRPREFDKALEEMTRYLNTRTPGDRVKSSSPDGFHEFGPKKCPWGRAGDCYQPRRNDFKAFEREDRFAKSSTR